MEVEGRRLLGAGGSGLEVGLFGPGVDLVEGDLGSQEVRVRVRVRVGLGLG